jgi:hypothetical protein
MEAETYQFRSKKHMTNLSDHFHEKQKDISSKHIVNSDSVSIAVLIQNTHALCISFAILLNNTLRFKTNHYLKEIASKVAIITDV